MSEFIRQKYPGSRVILGCPLGPVPQEMIARFGQRTALRMGRGIRPESDALIYGDRELILAEGKIFKWLDGLSKLPAYATLVTTTPELEEVRSWPVRLMLVTPWEMEPMRAAAAGLGVEIVLFETPEVHLYLDKLHGYWTQEAKAARADKKRARELLGLD